MLGDLSCQSFTPYVGQTFATSLADGERVELTLRSAEPWGAAPANGRAPFTLVFHGPQAPVLAQQIRALEHPAFPELAIFLVPNGPEGGAMRYEAVFT